MTDRPIIFSRYSIWATLNGRKTMTRRVLKPQPPDDWNPLPEIHELHRMVGGEPVEPRSTRDVIGMGWIEMDGLRGYRAPCIPGDQLWVRETWTTDGCADGEVAYRADGDAPSHLRVRWRSPIHMPRWASRITLDVTAVKVERVQDISYANLLAEGAPVTPFIADWDSINAKRPGCAWADNPWIVAVTFRPIMQNIDARIAHSTEGEPG